MSQSINQKNDTHQTLSYLYPSYFNRLMRWPYLFTPVIYLSKLLGILEFDTFKRLELFWFTCFLVQRTVVNARS
ncbi:hypothetical protein C2U51_14530 [Enterobacteriaceae bacterium ENNIH1]|nr:hypothetical protein C2U51_14530 [Enterobacteriaceae bacterium ENNIH1]